MNTNRIKKTLIFLSAFLFSCQKQSNEEMAVSPTEEEIICKDFFDNKIKTKSFESYVDFKDDITIEKNKVYLGEREITEKSFRAAVYCRDLKGYDLVNIAFKRDGLFYDNRYLYLDGMRIKSTLDFPFYLRNRNEMISFKEAYFKKIVTKEFILNTWNESIKFAEEIDDQRFGLAKAKRRFYEDVVMKDGLENSKGEKIAVIDGRAINQSTGDSIDPSSVFISGHYDRFEINGSIYTVLGFGVWDFGGYPYTDSKSNISINGRDLTFDYEYLPYVYDFNNDRLIELDDFESWNDERLDILSTYSKGFGLCSR